MATRREQPGWPPGERGTAEQEPGFLLGSGGPRWALAKVETQKRWESGVGGDKSLLSPARDQGGQPSRTQNCQSASALLQLDLTAKAVPCATHTLGKAKWEPDCHLCQAVWKPLSPPGRWGQQGGLAGSRELTLAQRR